MAKAEHKAININSRVEAITSHWHPELLLTLNNSHSMKVATIKGDFIWHSHPDTDEVFYCVSGGPFRIELSTSASSPEEAEAVGSDEVVDMKVGDVFCVPRGVQHRPVADVETGIMMIEKVGTTNTGEREGHERTVYVDER
jgi:mannose-6-phosphate isomerase-like protein (cupin superfamily)